MKFTLKFFVKSIQAFALVLILTASSFSQEGGRSGPPPKESNFSLNDAIVFSGFVDNSGHTIEDMPTAYNNAKNKKDEKLLAQYDAMFQQSCVAVANRLKKEVAYCQSFRIPGELASRHEAVPSRPPSGGRAWTFFETSRIKTLVEAKENKEIYKNNSSLNSNREERGTKVQYQFPTDEEALADPSKRVFLCFCSCISPKVPDDFRQNCILRDPQFLNEEDTNKSKSEQKKTTTRNSSSRRGAPNAQNPR